MHRLFALVCILIWPLTTAYGRWQWKDLDPMNRNSGIRRTLAQADPSAWANKRYNYIVHKIGNNIANMPSVEGKAERDGWTNAKCRVSGLALFTAIAGFQAVPICNATVGGEQLSANTCIALVVGTGGTITEIVCTTLCHNHKLLDCK